MRAESEPVEQKLSPAQAPFRPMELPLHLKERSRPLKALLLIPRIPDSVEYRPYLERVGSVDFLTWWIKRFTTRHSGIGLTVVCQTEGQASEARRACGRAKGVIFRADAGTTIRSLALAASASPEGEIALLLPGFAYAPPDLLSRAYAHHIATGNNYTRTLGLPHGTTPEIYSGKLLVRLSKLCLPGLPTAPGQAIEAIVRTSAVAFVTPPLRIRARPFDAAGAYNAVPQDLPEQILITGPRDIEVAQLVATMCTDSTGALDELRAWRKASLRTSSVPAGQDLQSVSATATGARGTNPLRVLFVSIQSAFSGAEQSLVNLVGAMERTRVEPLWFVGLQGVLARRLREAGAAVKFSSGAGGDAVGDAISLAAIIRKEKPHIIHLNAPSGLIPILARALWGVRVVSHMHVADTRGYEAQLKASDAVIAVSEFVRREVLKLEIPEERLRVIYNGVDTRAFRRDELKGPALRKKFGISRNAKVALMIARFTPQKRHDVLLEAARLAKHRLPRLFLLLNGEVFGESPAYDSVLATIKRWRMQSWVRIVPFVEDIRELHSVADLLVLCSEREAFGRCVIEAMAMGVPTVVTNSGGLPEIVKNADTGFVVPPGDPRSLAGQIVAVLSNPDLRTRVAAAARRQVEQKFDARSTAESLMELYDSLLRAPS